MRKTLIALLTMMVMIVPIAITETVSAEEPVNWGCTYLPGSNTSAQNYAYWTDPIYSYLTTIDNGYMRVQGNVSGAGITIVYYDHDFKTTSRRELDAELTLFGGFYESGNHYYIVTGQKNPDENDELEVYRITKYDKNWNRIGSCGLYGANTFVPFDAGCCRMDMTEQYLVIRTCHEMYKSDDGYHHQANVTILVDTDTMTITDSYFGVSSNSSGYVSHSFNQFVQLENNHIVSVDHGDAYPRGICLMQYPTDVTTGKFRSGRVVTTNVMSFPGSTGENKTGASVGGFEISDDSYLIAGNSVVQDDNNLSYKTRNVFIAAVDKDTMEINTNWLTNYEEGESTTSTPQMVKIDHNQFFVAWEKDDSVFYTFIDGQGHTLTDTYSLEGNLSDCVPIIDDGKIIWYTWNSSVETFYQIPITSPDNPAITEYKYEHHYHCDKTENGLAYISCDACGDEQIGKVPVDYMLLWTGDEGGYYYEYVPDSMDVGSTLSCWVYSFDYSAESENSFNDLVFEVDPEAADVEPNPWYEGDWDITWKKAGKHTITVYPKYNPDPALKRAHTYTVNVIKALEGVSVKLDKETPQPYGTQLRFTAQPDGGKGTLHYRFTLIDADNNETLLRDFASSDTFTWKINQVGTYTVRVDVKDTGDNNRTVSTVTQPLTFEKAAFPPGSPQGTITVPNKVTTVTNNILSRYPGWEFSDDSIGTELTVDEPVICTVVYTGADAENYESIETIIQVVRSEEKIDSVTRIYGSGRYETAFLVADELKEKLGVKKFDAVILADGRNYPDALAGSYLSSQFEAPILLVNNSHIPAVQDYIKENLNAEDGVIYILGGTGAVPDAVMEGMEGYTFERLAGASRYETNLEILKAGPDNDEIVVCTGKDYADSLSASAVGRPILLVKNTLQDNQKTYLESLGTGKIFYIIGGQGAVTKDVENALKAYGTVKRVFGSSRYDTSVEVAKEFFPDADAAVLAYGQNFPDGLCGGALACYINGASGQGGPLILTRDSKAQIAAAFTSEKEIKSGAVLGGTALISDESVRAVFQMEDDAEIIIIKN